MLIIKISPNLQSIVVLEPFQQVFPTLFSMHIPFPQVRLGCFQVLIALIQQAAGGGELGGPSTP